MPLEGQADKFVVGGIEAGVDPVLEVGGCGDFDFFLLFGKHDCWLVGVLK